MVDEKELKSNWKKFRNNPYGFLALVITIFLITGSFNYWLFSERLDSKNSVIDMKDMFLENKSQQITSLNNQIQDLKDEIKNMKLEQIKDNINAGAINISISNNNVQNLPSELILNASCAEKDVFISELAKKVNNQDKAIIICQGNNENLTEELEKLKLEIPEYDKGFVGYDFIVNKGSTFQADEGKFTLSVRDQEANSFYSRYWVTFILNGVEHKKNIGATLTFIYSDNQNYTLNIKGTGNPAKFFVYKN